MLNHTFVSKLRPAFFNLAQTQADDAARRFMYQTTKVRRIKYKSLAKERRKAVKRN